jgi:quinol monooxygenase YgiN
VSITVNLYYKGENGNAHKFAEEMEARGIADAIRAEEGNDKYEYFIVTHLFGKETPSS